jgi:hypothetical protein
VSPRRASFTEKDVRRALKAAKAEGFARVELIPSPEGLKLVIERDAKSACSPVSVEELEI